MKKVFLILLSFVFIIALTSCSIENQFSVFDDEEEMANNRMDEVLEAIEDKDKNKLKELFSKNAIAEAENFDENADLLFDYFKGDFVSYYNWAGPNSEMETDYGEKKKTLDATYDIETTKEKYRVSFIYVTVDTKNPDNAGIWSFYIIKTKDDTDPNKAYRGDKL